MGSPELGVASPPFEPAPRDVTTWYLEMRAPDELRAARAPAWPHRIERVLRPTAAFARYLYLTVGGAHHWTDRVGWAKARWDAHLLRDALELHTLQIGGAPVGFAELERQTEGNLQLTYFGLVPEVTGGGFGSALLTYAVQRAWQLAETRRVWVHTCTLDAPAALPNYQSRGFSLFRSETRSVMLGRATGPWPGWGRDGSG